MSADQQLSLFQFGAPDPKATARIDTPPKIPTKGHIEGIGHVRVLDYAGNGRFNVLDRQDNKRLVHRDRISFRR